MDSHINLFEINLNSFPNAKTKSATPGWPYQDACPLQRLTGDELPSVSHRPSSKRSATKLQPRKIYRNIYLIHRAIFDK